MNYFITQFLFLVLAKIVNVSREANATQTDQATKSFIEDLSDKEWHISHLKDPNFLEKRDEHCEDETFTDKVRRYKKVLKEDGALVEYVLAGGIPHSEKDFTENRSCNPKNTAIDTNQTIVKDRNNTVNDRRSNETIGLETDTLKHASIVMQPEIKTEKSRRGDYMFSSEEYYDEVVDFDLSMCPNTVDIIELYIDHLKDYDIECEALLEWRSLE